MTGSQDFAVIVHALFGLVNMYILNSIVCLLLPLENHGKSRHYNMLIYYRRDLMFSKIRWKEICAHTSIDNGDFDPVGKYWPTRYQQKSNIVQ